jgi:hypothetical protein
MNLCISFETFLWLNLLIVLCGKLAQVPVLIHVIMNPDFSAVENDSLNKHINCRYIFQRNGIF